MISHFDVEDRAVAVDRSADTPGKPLGRAFVWSPIKRSWIEPPGPLFVNKALLDGIALDAEAFAITFPGVPLYVKTESSNARPYPSSPAEWSEAWAMAQYLADQDAAAVLTKRHKQYLRGKSLPPTVGM